VTHLPDFLEKKLDYYFHILLPLFFLPPSDEKKRGHSGAVKKEVKVSKQSFLKKTKKDDFPPTHLSIYRWMRSQTASDSNFQS